LIESPAGLGGYLRGFLVGWQELNLRVFGTLRRIQPSPVRSGVHLALGCAASLMFEPHYSVVCSLVEWKEAGAVMPPASFATHSQGYIQDTPQRPIWQLLSHMQQGRLTLRVSVSAAGLLAAVLPGFSLVPLRRAIPGLA
jgi:hypothetical protein